MKKMGLLLLVALAVSFPVFAQTTMPPTTSAAPLPPAQVITLGRSVAALTGPWKFQPGDSPWVNGAPEWAQPGFDDSRWATMDLTPKAGSIDLQLGTAGFVPGWSRRGYPNLIGYAWYRLRVRVTDPNQSLQLKMPNNVDDAYQVYANGHYVGQFGVFSPNHVTMYYAQPVSFTLPAIGPDGDLDLAVRFYMSAATRFSNPDVGGMHSPPALGLASTVGMLQHDDEDAYLHREFSVLLRLFLFFLIAPLALWAWFVNRREPAWLWFFFALLCSILVSVFNVISGSSFKMTIATDTVFDVVILGSLVLPLWAMFWWYWFGLREKRWIPRVLWLLAAGNLLTTFVLNSPYLGLSLVPQRTLTWFNTVSLWCVAAQGVLLLVILAEGFRRDRTEAMLAALPIFLLEFSQFATYLTATFDFRSTFFPFGLGINVAQIGAVLMVAVIGVLALRRFVRTQVRDSLTRQSMKKDLEQAQQLQQRVLVPEAIHSPYFTVESEYRPAQTVGGDFFQTLSRPDGTLLVVIGDVSGKGVSAAMLVAVLVGAVRNQAEYSFDPAPMLAALNRRLMGRSGGHFATCLVAEISPDGKMRIANAGHLPPYLNGREMDLEGSLPLGIVAEADYRVRTFTLKDGDRLTFMTDGVVEATNRAKELFGFERTREISEQRAAAIAEQAQKFGQEDDITVLGVKFAGVAVEV